MQSWDRLPCRPCRSREGETLRAGGHLAEALADWLNGKESACPASTRHMRRRRSQSLPGKYRHGRNAGGVRSWPSAAILNSSDETSRDLLLQRHVEAAALRWLSRTKPFLPSGKPGSGGERHPSGLIVSPDRTKVGESGVEQECLGAARESSFCSSESARPVPASCAGTAGARA